MAIALGFHCGDSVVLCSDSQMIVPGPLQNEDVKVHSVSGSDWVISFTFAGYPHLAKLLQRQLRRELKRTTGFDSEELVKGLENSLAKLKASHGKQMGSQQFLCAISSCTEIPRLIRVQDDVIVTIGEWDAIGLGDSALIRSLVDSFWNDRMTAIQTVVTSAYLVAQAKKFIRACGGKTSIVILQRGCAEEYAGMHLEPYLEDIRHCLAKMFMTMSDIRTDRNDFDSNLRGLTQQAGEAWSKSRNEI